MNIQTISMSKKDAEAAFKEYRTAVQKNHHQEDIALMRGYKAIKKGKTLINLAEVMKNAGLNADGHPALAICRADASHVLFECNTDGSGYFQLDKWRKQHHTSRFVKLPVGTFPKTLHDKLGYNGLKTVVPSMPPRFRPPYNISGYHILWEVEHWDIIPKDPMLLKRLSGMLFAVLATWNLTELERVILYGK